MSQRPGLSAAVGYLGRYAPSPTGWLHLGTARTALVAWAAARSARGRVVLRIEDLDPPRVVPGAEQALIDDLRWLGVDWDEGPDVGGPAAPYRQSERASHYLDALSRLEQAGLVYPCWCSRKELRLAAAQSESNAPHGPADDGPRYPGTCATLDAAGRADRARETGRSPALRFRAPDETIGIDDRVCGRFAQNVAESVGDFVVRRADGLFAYQLAVVVDDGAMGVTEVVRGDDLLASAPRQIALFRALGLTPPTFAHLPLVRAPDGERLAKREGARAIRAMRDAGESPGSIVGRLAASLGLAALDEPLSPHQLMERFDWATIAANRT